MQSVDVAEEAEYAAPPAEEVQSLDAAEEAESAEGSPPAEEV